MSVEELSVTILVVIQDEMVDWKRLIASKKPLVMKGVQSCMSLTIK